MKLFFEIELQRILVIAITDTAVFYEETEVFHTGKNRCNEYRGSLSRNRGFGNR